MDKTAVMSRPGMSQGVRYGDVITIAGQVAYDDEWRLIGPGNMRAQAVKCFESVERVLHELGGTMDDLVEILAFCDNREILREYLKVREEVVSKEHPPATTTVVAQMATPGVLVEVKAIAVIGAWTSKP
jgi:2-iminobutanoate/2-iminopropanoate deaminase